MLENMVLFYFLLFAPHFLLLPISPVVEMSLSAFVFIMCNKSYWKIVGMTMNQKNSTFWPKVTSFSISQLGMIQKAEEERGGMRLNWNIKWRRDIISVVSVQLGLKVDILNKRSISLSHFCFCPDTMNSDEE